MTIKLLIYIQGDKTLICKIVSTQRVKSQLRTSDEHNQAHKSLCFQAGYPVSQAGFKLSK